MVPLSDEDRRLLTAPGPEPVASGYLLKLFGFVGLLGLLYFLPGVLLLLGLLVCAVLWLL